MERALIIIGTRAEAIKLAPVIKAMRGEIDAVLCATGEQPGLLDQALDTFGLTPDIRLDDKDFDTPVSQRLALLVSQIDNAILDSRPDWLVVQGDSASALAGGLAAFGQHVRLAHVEAGLRTGEPRDPFPQEGNRIMLARLATLHFAPTRHAEQNLLHEGVKAEAISVTGNTVVDAVAEVRRTLTRERRIRFDRVLPVDTRPVVLFTCRRAEGQDDLFIDMCVTLEQLCRDYPRHHWIFPVFPDPAMHEIVHRILPAAPNLTVMDPLPYPQLLHLLDRAALLVTDSGGLQEEAPSFGLPAVIVRDHTERPESIGAGAATLAGSAPLPIHRAVADWLEHPDRRKALTRRNPYGDGGAAPRIVTALLRHGRDMR